MKLFAKVAFALALALCIGAPVRAEAPRQVTTTLLPDKENEDGPGGTLWIQREPKKEIVLQFDLTSFPPALGRSDLQGCWLRLVASDPRYQPDDNVNNTGGGDVLIRGRGVKDGSYDVAFTDITPDAKVAIGESDRLCGRVYEAYSAGKPLTVLLDSGSDKAGALFYSTANSGRPPNPSNAPRLIVRYAASTARLPDTLVWPQYQQNPEHTGRTPWKPYQNPTGFSLQAIDLSAGSIADYPLIYRGDIYLINTILGQNFLVSLDSRGKELWRKVIGTGVVQRSPAISRRGVMYVPTEAAINRYDLNRAGEDLNPPYSLPGKLSDYTDLTIGNDGSLFAAIKEGEVNYMYGFTAGLIPYLKTPPLGKGQDKISTLTASPDGGKLFAQAPAGAIAVDLIDPSKPATIKPLRNEISWRYYHTPVAGPDGRAAFADFDSSGNRGHVWGTAAAKAVWGSTGTLIPQPVLGSNGTVHFIQDGKLQGQTVSGQRFTTGGNLKTTSNLVMDGADNIYFWDNGVLYGFGAAGRLFPGQEFTAFAQKGEGDGPEQFIRLMVGPDGTLWANNKNGSSLYAFHPLYAKKVGEQEPDLSVPERIADLTVYRTNGTLSAGKAEWEPGARVLFQGKKGISFGPGFAVPKGASLLCRTGS